MENLIASEKNQAVKLVFTSAKGDKFFAHHEALTISPERGVAAEESRRYAQMCLSKGEMKALIAEYKKGVNNQDIVYSHSIIQEMEFRLNYLTEENSLFDLACLYFFIEGEDIRTPSEHYNNLKRKLFKRDSDVRGFFLPIALSLMNEFSQKQGEDLLIYLEEMKNQSKRINRFIAENTWMNQGSGLTT